MQHLLEVLTGRLTDTWNRRSEFARRFREEDRGAITVEMVMWIAAGATLAITVGAIFYSLVIAKAKSISL